ncbi:hypothetical protein GCM10009562_25860 [Nocardioides aquaticus]
MLESTTHITECGSARRSVTGHQRAHVIGRREKAGWAWVYEPAAPRSSYTAELSGVSSPGIAAFVGRQERHLGVLDPMGSRAEPADPHPGGSDKEQDDGSEKRNEGEARKNPRLTCVLEGLRPFAGGPLSAVSVLGVEDQRTDVESGAHDDQ